MEMYRKYFGSISVTVSVGQLIEELSETKFHHVSLSTDHTVVSGSVRGRWSREPVGSHAEAPAETRAAVPVR